MNPIKILQKSIPDLAKVIESIHAYLERQLEVQKKMLEELEGVNKRLELLIKDEKDN